MMLDDIVVLRHMKRKRRAMDKECWTNLMPKTCFRAEHQ